MVGIRQILLNANHNAMHFVGALLCNAYLVALHFNEFAALHISCISGRRPSTGGCSADASISGLW